MMVGLQGCSDAPPVVPADADETTKVVGLLVERSPLPDPKTSSYKDCLFTATVVLQDPPGDMAGRIAVAFSGFTNRIPTAAAALSTNRALRLELVAFHAAPRAIQQTRLADTLNEPGLPLYFAREWQMHQATELTAFEHPNATSGGAKGVPAPLNLEPQALAAGLSPMAVPEGLSPFQQAFVERDIAHIEAQFEQAGGDWGDWQAKQAAQASDLLNQLRAQGKLVGTNQAGLVEWLSTDPFTREWNPEGEAERQLVVTMQQLRDNFRELGADLVVVPVPHRAEVTATFFTDTPLPHPPRLRAHLELLRAGVEVVDLFPALAAEMKTSTSPLYHYGTADIHPAAAALRTAARELAPRLERITDRPPTLPELSQQRVDGNTTYPFISLRTLSKQQPLNYPQDSPLLVIGDSFVRTPEAYGIQGANIAAHLAFETGLAPTYFIRVAESHRIAHHLGRMPLAYVQNRRVVVFFLNGDYLFPARRQWAAFDFLSQQREVERDVQVFHHEAKTVVKYDTTTGWDGWRCSPSGGGPHKGTFGLSAARELRKVTIPATLPAGEHLFQLTVKSQHRSSLVWETGTRVPFAFENYRCHILRRFETREPVEQVSIHVPFQSGWILIEALEIKSIPNRDRPL